MSEQSLFKKLFSTKPSQAILDGERQVVDLSNEVESQPDGQVVKDQDSYANKVQNVMESTPLAATTSDETLPTLDQNLDRTASAGETKTGDIQTPEGMLDIPVLGKRSVTEHQRILAALLGLALLVWALIGFYALTQADKVSQQLSGTGQTLMQAQRLAKSVSQALVGSPQAFPDVKESADVLAKTILGLKNGDDAMNLSAVSTDMQEDLEKISPMVDRAEKNARTVLQQQKVLTEVGSALRNINRQSADLLEIAETVSSLKLQQNAAPTEISAAGQLVMLTQRIGKSANEFLTMEGVSPEAVFLLGKDLNSFKEIAQGLQSGSSELRLVGTKDPQTKERLDALLKLYDQTKLQAVQFWVICKASCQHVKRSLLLLLIANPFVFS